MPYKDKEKKQQYQLRWIKKRRRDWLSAHGPCAKCGSDRNLRVDHIDPREKITHRIWSWSRGRQEKELKKCQVLCLACHKLKTKIDVFCRAPQKKGKGASKYKGVHWHPEAHKWRARIKVRGKPTQIGMFHTEVDAAKAYDQMVLKLIGPTAFVNFK